MKNDDPQADGGVQSEGNRVRCRLWLFILGTGRFTGNYIHWKMTEPTL